MLQAIGLTSIPRRERPPAVTDLTFEARPGAVTVLLGAPGAGKTTALRLMLGLERGRGATYFRGRPLHLIEHPAREVGALLGDVPGHPGRSVRGHLRMLCSAVGVPSSRADELLDVVGLAAVRDERLGALSVGMDRRLGVAAALLGDPHTLLLDTPAAGLSAREGAWLHGVLRAHADSGGTVLCTTSDPKEAARTADRVVTVDAGRLVADQEGAAFAATRLRPRVAVLTPHAARLADALSREARAGHRSVEVVPHGGTQLLVYGSSCPEIGDTAFRHGVLVHRLADEIGDMGPLPQQSSGPREEPAACSAAPSAPPALALDPHPARGPLHPLRYELRRMFGVRTAPVMIAAAVLASVGLAVPLARTGSTPVPGLLAAWPALLPLPPAAAGAGLLGALSFGDEYRHPALAPARGTVPRRVALLLAKLAVTAGAALLLALGSAAADAAALRLVYGARAVPLPGDWPLLAAGWAALAIGCGWAGLLGAGIFRITAAGVTAVLAVPVLVVPLLRRVLSGPSVRSAAGLPARLREAGGFQWPRAADGLVAETVRLVAQPVAAALVLSLAALFCAYALTAFRQRAHW